METVQIQCGSCGKVMAIAVQHLGSQVHCPHCQIIVQTPPRPAPGSSAPEIPAIRPDIGEMESIFAGPEVSEDLFETGPARPLVEMPSEAPSRQAAGGQAPKKADNDHSTVTEAFPSPSAHKVPMFSLDKAKGEPAASGWAEAPTELQDAPEFEAPRSQSPRSEAPRSEAPRSEGPRSATPRSEAPRSEAPRSAAPLSSEDASPSFTIRTPRPAESRGLFIPILLIFLIPYSILATVVIAYLYFNQGSAFDPMELLPDPKPKEGPRKQDRVAHYTPLPAKLKTPLARSLRIGDMEVHPVKVQVSSEGDLILHLKLRNHSGDMVIRPISDDFLKVNLASMSASRPYTFLEYHVLGEDKERSQKRLYGGFLEYGILGEERESTGDLVPGKEDVLRIITLPNYRKDIAKLLDSQETLLWRVQIRRGLIQVRGTSVSATAVVGVEFSAAAIEKEKAS